MRCTVSHKTSLITNTATFPLGDATVAGLRDDER
jgi:hypothetical protein